MSREVASSSSNHILVVDRSAVSRELVARMLRAGISGSEVVTCKTGAEALGLIQQQHFDLITTSLMLPDIDGLDLCLQIRQFKSHRYTPVVVISGDADTRLLKEGYAAGVTDYFDKSQGYHAFTKFITEFDHRNQWLVGHILYVEDSRTAAAITIPILEKHGLQVSHVTSAEEAYNLLSATRQGRGEDYDLIVTDFYLEFDMTGGDLLHAIRARMHYSRQELPVLVITGSDDIDTQVELFHAGANDFIGKPLIEEILMARIRSLLLIKHQYNTLQSQAKKMEQISVTDTLTGVFNRRFLMDSGEPLRQDAYNQPLWVTIVDIDHFKQINDTQGHLVGDHVLVGLGELFLNKMSEATPIRFGGEEFVLLFPQLQPKDALIRLEQLRMAVEELNPCEIPVTISIGAVDASRHPDKSLNELIKLADKALYAAKENGRNRIYISMDEQRALPIEEAALIITVETAQPPTSTNDTKTVANNS
ncbi:MAG TPA: diguanylate cyclase [Ectothiorhodospiraceae bacterium]|nr:diguanylate cyclase [Ectothiorhodospiraceae bacterium]